LNSRGMSNEQREEVGRLHWLAAVNLWKMGYSAEMIAQVYGYKDAKNFLVKKNQLKKTHPDWFPARPSGFTPLPFLAKPEWREANT